MTTKDVKEYLSRVKNIIRTEHRIVSQINRLKDRQLSIEINLSGMPRGTTFYTMADYVSDLDELQRKLMDSLAEERKVYKEILIVLNNLEGIQREIMIKHYLMLMTWEEIAVSEGLTYRWIQTLHGRALSELAKIM